MRKGKINGIKIELHNISVNGWTLNTWTGHKNTVTYTTDSTDPSEPLAKKKLY